MKKHKQDSGFSVVELLVVLFVLILVGSAGWLVYKNHSQHEKISVLSSSTSARYLPITQLGIRIPLSFSDLDDITYAWDTTKSTSQGTADIYSLALAKVENNIAPECASSVNIKQGVYLGTINITSITNGQDEAAYKYIEGKLYAFWSSPEGSYGCSQMTTTQAGNEGPQISKYTLEMKYAFSNAIPIN